MKTSEYYDRSVDTQPFSLVRRFQSFKIISPADVVHKPYSTLMIHAHNCKRNQVEKIEMNQIFLIQIKCECFCRKVAARWSVSFEPGGLFTQHHSFLL